MFKVIAKVLIALALLPSLVAVADEAVTCNPSDIIGNWQFTEYIYDGKIHPPMNPNLIMQFQFYADGHNLLHWTRSDSRFFCKRTGQYTYNKNNPCELIDKIVAVDPKNGPSCGSDPDMQVGREATTRLDFKDGKMRLHLTLSDKPFVYVWTKID